MPRSGSFTHRKRSAPQTVDYLELGIEMMSFVNTPTKIQKSQYVYDMDKPDERLSLITCLWTGDFGAALDSVCAVNRELHTMLRVCVANTYEPVDPIAYERQRSLQLECTMNNLVRIQSNKKMPLLTAAHSVMAERDQLGGPLWDTIKHANPGLLASERWTRKLMYDARLFRPTPVPQINGVAALVFDNYTRRCLYKSQVAAAQGGYRLDMTNYGSIRIPASLAPPNFDPESVFSKLYRNDVSLRQFVSRFNWHNHHLLTNKQQRFSDFIKAALAGQLFKRPNTTPTWVVEIDWELPMWGVLQSQNAHVRFEINKMRRTEAAKDAKVVIIGGDGLSIHRGNHILAQDPETYLDTSPAVVPMLGEMPHGHHHIMHAVIRDFAPYIMKAANQVGNPAIVADPAEVKYYNSHVHFFSMLTRASSEYLGEISRGPGGLDFEDVPSFIAACEENIDLAWVVHFLYDAGFLVHQFKQSVRSNNSAVLDDLWCEFVTIARTANKTIYGPLAIMQVSAHSFTQSMKLGLFRHMCASSLCSNLLCSVFVANISHNQIWPNFAQISPKLVLGVPRSHTASAT